MAMTGGAKLEARLNELARGLDKKSTLRVGFLEGATYPDGMPVATIAAIMDGGAPSKGIPPRPFFRNTIADESPHWGDDVAKILPAVGYDAETTMLQMGALIEGEIRQHIVDMSDPPNSPVTNLLKQRFPMGGQTFADVLQARKDVANGVTAPAGKPLVQSGVMLGSVDSEVTT